MPSPAEPVDGLGDLLGGLGLGQHDAEQAGQPGELGDVAVPEVGGAVVDPHPGRPVVTGEPLGDPLTGLGLVRRVHRVLDVQHDLVRPRGLGGVEQVGTRPVHQQPGASVLGTDLPLSQHGPILVRAPGAPATDPGPGRTGR